MAEQVLFADRGLCFEQLRLLEAPAVAARVNGGIVDVTASTLAWLEDGVGSLARAVGDVRVDEIGPQEIYEWHAGLLRRMRAVSANSYLRAVKTLYGRLLGAGIVAANPARPVRFAPEPPPRPKAVGEGHYLAMRAAAAGARDRAIVDMLWASGCRLGGLVSMKVSAIELWRAGGELRAAAVVVEKFGKSRYVYARSPQADSLEEWLRERPAAAHEAVFVSVGDGHYGRPLSGVAVQHVLRRLRRAANIPAGAPANAHAFRHAYAIRMLDAGHDLAAVSAWLGHADPSFTARKYATRREDELRRKWFGGE